MTPAIPSSETTNPKPWQAVTDMVGCRADTEYHSTGGQSSSESAECQDEAFLERLAHTSPWTMEGGGDSTVPPGPAPRLYLPK